MKAKPLIFVRPNAPFTAANVQLWHKLNTGMPNPQAEAAFRARGFLNLPYFQERYRRYRNLWHEPRHVIPGRPNPHHPKGFWGQFAGPYVNYYHGSVRPFYQRHKGAILAGTIKAKRAEKRLRVGLSMPPPNRNGPNRSALPPVISTRIAAMTRRGWMNALPKPPSFPPPRPSPPKPRKIPRVKTRPMPNRYSPSNGNKTLANRWPKAASAPAAPVSSRRVTRSSRRSAK